MNHSRQKQNAPAGTFNHKGLRYMWDRHGHGFLKTYLRSGRQHIFSHPQHYATRDILRDIINERHNGFRLPTDSWPYNVLIRLYARSGIWNTDWRLPGRILEMIVCGSVDTKKPAANGAATFLLDAGCGSGNFYESFSKTGMFPFIDYVGIDISRKNIQNCRELYPGVRFEVGDIQLLPFPDQSFDVVLASRVLEYLPITGMEQALRELMRVSRDAVIINFFCERDSNDHVEREVLRYNRNCISKIRLLEFLRSFPLAIQMLDHYGPFGAGKKIEYIDGLGNLISLSTWVLRKQNLSGQVLKSSPEN